MAFFQKPPSTPEELEAAKPLALSPEEVLEFDEAEWYERAYRGDEPQLTGRAIAMGTVLGSCFLGISIVASHLKPYRSEFDPTGLALMARHIYGGTGVLFYMIGALSQFGKLGMTCIGNSPEQAGELFQRTVALLDKETGHGDATHEELGPLFDNTVRME